MILWSGVFSGRRLTPEKPESFAFWPAYEMLRQGSMPKSKSVFGQLLNGILGDGKPGTVREQRIDCWFISGLSLPPDSTDVATKPTTTAGR